MLFRERTANPKGRDWYDLLWYVGRGTPVHLAHLEARARQSDHWKGELPMTRDALAGLLEDKLAATDLGALKADVRPFIRDAGRLAAWTPELFRAAFARIKLS